MKNFGIDNNMDYRWKFQYLNEFLRIKKEFNENME